MAIKPDKRNAKKGTERGRYMVEASLRETGAGRSILLDGNDQVIAGNKTLEAATDIGIPVRIVETDGTELIAVKRTDLDLDDDTGLARKLAYYDNRASQVGLEWDAEVILGDLNAGVDLSALFRDDELDELLADLQPKTEIDAEPQIDRAEELRQKWGVNVGDLWQLGDHRLICGDCTDAAVVARLGEFTAINTDPPYGIDAVGSDGRIGLAAVFGRIEGDMVPFEPAHILELSSNVVLWGANHYANKLPSSAAWLVWDKRDGDRHNDFADCELAWCSGDGVVRIFSHLWMGYSRASERGEARAHPTQKPVSVISWAIEQRTSEKDIIADFYAGSGTTIIACENLGRKCRAVEISPGYVAVALERWSTATGKTPALLTD